MDSQKSIISQRFGAPGRHPFLGDQLTREDCISLSIVFDFEGREIDAGLRGIGAGQHRDGRQYYSQRD